MTVPPMLRLSLFVLAAMLPVWQEFVTTSQDFTLRGLLKPVIASLYAGAVVLLARTKNPDVDGDKPQP